MKAEQSSTVRLDVVLALTQMPVDDVPLYLNAQWTCLDESGKSATKADYRNLGEMTRAVLKSNAEVYN